MTILYFDCFSGAAGDMFLGALVDAGAPASVVTDVVAALGIDNAGVRFETTTKAGLRATAAVVTIDAPQPPRAYSDIVTAIESAPLDGAIQERSLEVFGVLAEAEARVHGVPVEEVHFHELGAADALIDIVGACAAFQHFGAPDAHASAVATGTGSVETDHGTMPLPPPVVVEILRGVPLVGRGHDELITPTGAALLKVFCQSFGTFPAMTVERAGYGAGTSDYSHPNVLRVLVGSPASVAESTLTVIEANLDDTNPEWIPYVVERLIDAGAQDAWATPIVMKKGRPAVTLSVLCRSAESPALTDILLSETTTLGVRMHEVHRQVLDREWTEVAIDGHSVRVKIARRAGRVVSAAPEFEDARLVALATGRPLKEVYDRALRAVQFD